MAVQTGIDRLIADPAPLAGRRVGLFTNPSGTTAQAVPTLAVFQQRPDFGLRALFSPEHGLAAAAKDGEHVESGRDPASGVPIHSLYQTGGLVAPTAAMLADLDVIVVDLQDVGARFYTFVWSLSLILEGAGAAGVPVLLLDRPNPIGAHIDGPLLQPAFASAVGRAPMPIQHGATLGELARWFNALHNPTPADLTVIPCAGYAHGLPWEQTGLPFVPPSPAMAHLETARHYPGACLVEGTSLSEGRGTALPFEIMGAPSLDGDRLADHLNALAADPGFADGLRGVVWRPHTFQPCASKHGGALCSGVQAHISDYAAFRPVAAWLAAVRATRDLFPEHFAFRESAFDRLYGSDAGRAWVESGAPLAPLLAEWQVVAAAWASTIAPFRLYSEATAAPGLA